MQVVQAQETVVLVLLARFQASLFFMLAAVVAVPIVAAAVLAEMVVVATALEIVRLQRQVL